MTTLVRLHGGDREALASIGALRLAAWAPILGPDTASERFAIDRHDHAAWHCTVFAGDLMVAAGRLTVHRELADLPESTSFGPYREHMRAPLGLASRLVVDPCHRGRGFAGQIIADRVALAADEGLQQVWGETREEQVHGLARHGYETIGPSADDSVPGTWIVIRAALTRSGEG